MSHLTVIGVFVFEHLSESRFIKLKGKYRDRGEKDIKKFGGGVGVFSFWVAQITQKSM